MNKHLRNWMFGNPITILIMIFLCKDLSTNKSIKSKYYNIVNINIYTN